MFFGAAAPMKQKMGTLIIKSMCDTVKRSGYERWDREFESRPGHCVHSSLAMGQSAAHGVVTNICRNLSFSCSLMLNRKMPEGEISKKEATHDCSFRTVGRQ